MDITLGSTVTVAASTQIWLSEVRAGRGFILGTGNGPTAAAFSETQLFNPAGSGVQCIVRATLISPSSSSGVTLRRFDTALATIIGQGVNLLAGAAAGKAAVRIASPAAQDGALVAAVDLSALSTTNIFPEWGYELSPGQGVLVVPDIVNVGIKVVYIWREV